MQKESLRTGWFGGRYSHHFAGGFALWRCRNSIRRYLAALNASSEASSRYSRSVASILTSRHSSCTQFSLPSRTECHRMTRRRISSAPGTKAETASKTHPELSALSFRFYPKDTPVDLQRVDSELMSSLAFAPFGFETRLLIKFRNREGNMRKDASGIISSNSRIAPSLSCISRQRML